MASPFNTNTQGDEYVRDVVWNGYDANLRPEVVNILNAAQQTVDFPITLKSGYRDPARNAAAGGAKQSQHLTGNAVDISVVGLTDAQRTQLTRALADAGANRLGVYSGNTTIHMDLAQGYAVPEGIKSDFYPMYDRTIQKIGQAPSWFKQAMAGGGPIPPRNVPNPPPIPNRPSQALADLRNGLPGQPATTPGLPPGWTVDAAGIKRPAPFTGPPPVRNGTATSRAELGYVPEPMAPFQGTRAELLQASAIAKSMFGEKNPIYQQFLSVNGLDGNTVGGPPRPSTNLQIRRANTPASNPTPRPMLQTRAFEAQRNATPGMPAQLPYLTQTAALRTQRDNTPATDAPPRPMTQSADLAARRATAQGVIPPLPRPRPDRTTETQPDAFSLVRNRLGPLTNSQRAAVAALNTGSGANEFGPVPSRPAARLPALPAPVTRDALPADFSYVRNRLGPLTNAQRAAVAATNSGSGSDEFGPVPVRPIPTPAPRAQSTAPTMTVAERNALAAMPPAAPAPRVNVARAYGGAYGTPTPAPSFSSIPAPKPTLPATTFVSTPWQSQQAQTPAPASLVRASLPLNSATAPGAYVQPPPLVPPPSRITPPVIPPIAPIPTFTPPNTPVPAPAMTGLPGLNITPSMTMAGKPGILDLLLVGSGALNGLPGFGAGSSGGGAPRQPLPQRNYYNPGASEGRYGQARGSVTNSADEDARFGRDSSGRAVNAGGSAALARGERATSGGFMFESNGDGTYRNIGRA